MSKSNGKMCFISPQESSVLFGLLNVLKICLFHHRFHRIYKFGVCVIIWHVMYEPLGSFLCWLRCWGERKWKRTPEAYKVFGIYTVWVI